MPAVVGSLAYQNPVLTYAGGGGQQSMTASFSVSLPSDTESALLFIMGANNNIGGLNHTGVSLGGIGCTRITSVEIGTNTAAFNHAYYVNNPGSGTKTVQLSGSGDIYEWYAGGLVLAVDKTMSGSFYATRTGCCVTDGNTIAVNENVPVAAGGFVAASWNVYDQQGTGSSTLSSRTYIDNPASGGPYANDFWMTWQNESSTTTRAVAFGPVYEFMDVRTYVSLSPDSFN